MRFLIKANGYRRLVEGHASDFIVGNSPAQANQSKNLRIQSQRATNSINARRKRRNPSRTHDNRGTSPSAMIASKDAIVRST